MSSRPLLANSRQRDSARGDSYYGSVQGPQDEADPLLPPLRPTQSSTLDKEYSQQHHPRLDSSPGATTTRSDPLPALALKSSTFDPSQRQADDKLISELKADVAAGQIKSGLDGPLMASSAMPAEIGLDATQARSRLASSAERPDSLNHWDDEAEDDATSRDALLRPSASRHSDSYDTDPIDNSPYPQVRASVSATDDITLSINTPRMWFLSMFFAVLGSATNMFFSLRYPSVSITPVIALLLVHPLGLIWDAVLKRPYDPEEAFSLGDLDNRKARPGSPDSTDFQPTSSRAKPGVLDRFRLWLAQGRWNEKEHACVYIASNVSFGFAFATDVIVEQSMFYKQEAPILYQLLLTISTQVLGYAIAGVTRRYLVHPSGMIWPATLISTAMFSTLHREENVPADGWRMSRWKFFSVIFGGSFVWYFVPGLLAPALSFFNVITWFAPRSVPIANFFGVSSGLGMFPITFDWSQIAYTGSPLVVPFWAALNVAGGLIFVMWFLAPILYYTNTLYSAYMPMLSASVYDNRSNTYDVGRILNSDFTFDFEEYKKYSPVYLPITYVLSYAAQFASITALLTHTALWHGKAIVTQWRASLNEIKSSAAADLDPPSPTSYRRSSTAFSQPEVEQMMNAEDVHNRLMKRYKDVPAWWYILTGAIMLAIGMFVVEYYPVHLPWYGLLLAIGICCILFIPIGIVMAITAQQSSIYLVCQLVCGFLFPGRPVANMIFVTYGYITSTQALKFSSDLKLGHYMKIPPILLFKVQLAATLIASCTQISVLNWMLARVKGICTPTAINGFTCPLAKVHFNGSILWGVLGPDRFLGRQGMYSALLWAFPFGAVAPFFVWYMAKRSPPSRAEIWKKVNLPVVLGSLSWIPPATGINFSVWALVCYIFNHVIRKRHEAWWRKYNMTLSAALDAGVAFGVAVVFFAVVYPGFVDNFHWWGTEIFKQGCDWFGCSLISLPKGEHFGPDRW